MEFIVDFPVVFQSWRISSPRCSMAAGDETICALARDLEEPSGPASMALFYFKVFASPHVHLNEPIYWMMMQIAMVCEFVTALPIDWLLVNIGCKEAMG